MSLLASAAASSTGHDDMPVSGGILCTDVDVGIGTGPGSRSFERLPGQFRLSARYALVR